MSLKKFIKQHKNRKLKPSKTEWIIWGVISIITFGIPILISCLPFIKKEFATDIKDKIIIGLISVTVGWLIKSAASMVSTATKKVDSWFYNKLINNQEKREKEKIELKSIIKNLTSDKPETRLEAESDILKQELDNNKNKSINKLINDEILNHNSNSILENSSVESLNPNNFDSSIRDTVNNQDPQPSTSTGIYHSNWIS